MNDITLNPYLFFKGNAEEALQFYKSVFGGTVFIQKYGEGDWAPSESDMKGKVMHGKLSGGDVLIMAADSKVASDKAAKVDLSLSGVEEEKLKSIYEKLSAGGKITAPLKKAPWGDQFAMFCDKYDIEWMINITSEENAAANKQMM